MRALLDRVRAVQGPAPGLAHEPRVGLALEARRQQGVERAVQRDERPADAPGVLHPRDRGAHARRAARVGVVGVAGGQARRAERHAGPQRTVVAGVELLAERALGRVPERGVVRSPRGTPTRRGSPRAQSPVARRRRRGRRAGRRAGPPEGRSAGSDPRRATSARPTPRPRRRGRDRARAPPARRSRRSSTPRRTCAPARARSAGPTARPRRPCELREPAAPLEHRVARLGAVGEEVRAGVALVGGREGVPAREEPVGGEVVHRVLALHAGRGGHRELAVPLVGQPQDELRVMAPAEP